MKHTAQLLQYFADDLAAFSLRILTDTIHEINKQQANTHEHTTHEHTKAQQRRTLKLVSLLQEFTEYIEAGRVSHRQPLIYFSHLLRGFVEDMTAAIEEHKTVFISCDDLRYIRKYIRKTWDDLTYDVTDQLREEMSQRIQEMKHTNAAHIQSTAEEFTEWIDNNTTEEEDRERMYDVINQAAAAEKQRTGELWDALAYDIDHLFNVSSPSLIFQLVGLNPYAYLLDRSDGIESRNWHPFFKLAAKFPGLSLRLLRVAGLDC